MELGFSKETITKRNRDYIWTFTFFIIFFLHKSSPNHTFLTHFDYSELETSFGNTILINQGIDSLLLLKNGTYALIVQIESNTQKWIEIESIPAEATSEQISNIQGRELMDLQRKDSGFILAAFDNGDIVIKGISLNKNFVKIEEKSKVIWLRSVEKTNFLFSCALIKKRLNVWDITNTSQHLYSYDLGYYPSYGDSINGTSYAVITVFGSKKIFNIDSSTDNFSLLFEGPFDGNRQSLDLGKNVMVLLEINGNELASIDYVEAKLIFKFTSQRCWQIEKFKGNNWFVCMPDGGNLILYNYKDGKSETITTKIAKEALNVYSINFYHTNLLATDKASFGELWYAGECSAGQYATVAGCRPCAEGCNTCSIAANQCETCKVGFFGGNGIKCWNCEETCLDCENVDRSSCPKKPVLITFFNWRVKEIKMSKDSLPRYQIEFSKRINTKDKNIGDFFKIVVESDNGEKLALVENFEIVNEGSTFWLILKENIKSEIKTIHLKIEPLDSANLKPEFGEGLLKLKVKKESVNVSIKNNLYPSLLNQLIEGAIRALALSSQSLFIISLITSFASGIGGSLLIKFFQTVEIIVRLAYLNIKYSEVAQTILDGFVELDGKLNFVQVDKSWFIPSFKYSKNNIYKGKLIFYDEPIFICGSMPVIIALYLASWIFIATIPIISKFFNKDLENEKKWKKKLKVKAQNFKFAVFSYGCTDLAFGSFHVLIYQKGFSHALDKLNYMIAFLLLALLNYELWDYYRCVCRIKKELLFIGNYFLYQGQTEIKNKNRGSIFTDQEYEELYNAIDKKSITSLNSLNSLNQKNLPKKNGVIEKYEEIVKRSPYGLYYDLLTEGFNLEKLTKKGNFTHFLNYIFLIRMYICCAIIVSTQSFDPYVQITLVFICYLSFILPLSYIVVKKISVFNGWGQVLRTVLLEISIAYFLVYCYLDRKFHKNPILDWLGILFLVMISICIILEFFHIVKEMLVSIYAVGKKFLKYLKTGNKVQQKNRSPFKSQKVNGGIIIEKMSSKEFNCSIPIFSFENDFESISNQSGNKSIDLKNKPAGLEQPEINQIEGEQIEKSWPNEEFSIKKEQRITNFRQQITSCFNLNNIEDESSSQELFPCSLKENPENVCKLLFNLVNFKRKGFQERRKEKREKERKRVRGNGIQMIKLASTTKFPKKSRAERQKSRNKIQQIENRFGLQKFK